MSIEIINTRLIDAPQTEVFSAFEKPQSLAQWWGPIGFTNTILGFDLRPGGRWRIVIKDPDGVEYDNVSCFLEVRTPQKVIYEHLEPMLRFEMTMTFSVVHESETELTWRMVLNRSAENENLRAFLFEANEQNFDRLCAFLGRPVNRTQPRRQSHP